ncbi:MAG: hypothetical protein Q4D30_11310 [Bacteroidales bacterium]|nr:hypothetical protein [Bacteroidales bacterium]
MNNTTEKEIKEHWKQIIDLFCKNYDKNKKRLETRLGKDNIPDLVIKDKGSRIKAQDIFVQFEDGTELSTKKMNGAELLVKFIEKVGVDIIENLNIKDRNGYPLINDSTKGIEKMAPKPVKDKFVITKTGNKEKFAQIKDIIDRLNLSVIAYQE